MRKLFFLFCAISISSMTFGQGVILSSNPAATPDASAIFEVAGTLGPAAAGGVLIPRMTEAERLTLGPSAAEGLWIYQTDNHKGYFLYTGSSWTRISSPNSVTGRVDVNPTTGLYTGITGSGFTATQNGGDPGLFDVSFTPGTYSLPPSVMLTSAALAPITTGTEPINYCQPVHQNNCTTPVAADYIDDVRVQSCPGGACAPYTATGPISFQDNNTGCNNTANNYVNNYGSVKATLYGSEPSTGGTPGSFFNITMQSGPEWRDNLFAFIDWNQDADFQDPGEVVLEHYFVGTVPFDAVITEPFVTVPASASNGLTVLRTMTLFVVGTPEPCGDFPWGETQDYKVEVFGGDPNASANPRGTLCTVGNVTNSGFQVYCTDLNDNRKGTSFHFYSTDN